jgi:hypothetical protein
MNWFRNWRKDKDNMPATKPQEPNIPSYKDSSQAAAIQEKLNIQSIGEIVKKIQASAIKRYKQELIGENDELLDRSLRRYRSKIARQAWKVSQKWCKWKEEGPLLMPDNVRIFYSRGKTEVVVQEFPPQVRLMKFRGALCKRENTDVKLSQEESTKVFQYSLALPYMVFIYRLVDGLLNDVYVAFNDRPLKTLGEKPLRPYLSKLECM